MRLKVSSWLRVLFSGALLLGIGLVLAVMPASAVGGTPSVTNVAPNCGPAGATTGVGLTGFNFTASTSATFGTTAGTAYHDINDNGATVTSPALAAGTVHVHVTSPFGTSPNNGTFDQFTFMAAPTVTSVSPPEGPIAGGRLVTVNGTNFGPISVVKVAGAAQATTFVNSSQLTFTTPAHASGQVHITVTTCGATTVTSPADLFTYIDAPTVTNVVVNTGPAAGGTSVTISGTGFFEGGATSEVKSVRFGNALVSSPVASGDSQMTVFSPPYSTGDPATVDVVVATNDGGSSATSGADQYTYTFPVPTVTSVAPSDGAASGGTTNIVITGTGFTGASGAAGVKFGATNAGGYTVDSDTQITAVSPVGAAGPVDVRVTTPLGGISQLNNGSCPGNPCDQFTYVPAPTVTSVAAGSGLTSGGTVVTIGGTNFTGFSGTGPVTVVKFGTTVAPTFHVDSAIQITATTPAHAAGTVDVRVTSEGGQSAVNSPNDQFTFVPPPVPTVTLVSPHSGGTAGGTAVSITGSGFFGGTGGPNVTSIDFGGSVLTSGYTVTNDTTISVAGTPSHAGGTVDVRVTTGGGTSAVVPASGNGSCPSSPCDHFTYVAPVPGVTSVTPNLGPPAGGTGVTILGHGFTAATAVQFAAVNAPGYNVVDDTHITVNSPPSAGGTPRTVDVTVTTAGGTSPTATGGCPDSTPCDQFTYVAPPTVTLVTPNSGPPNGNTAVVIEGTNFTGFNGMGAVSAVKFGAVDAQDFSVTDDNHISAHSTKTQPEGTVDVTVVGGGGTSAIDTGGCPSAPCDRFTYVTPQIVASQGSDDSVMYNKNHTGWTSLGGLTVAAPAVVSVPSPSGGVPLFIVTGADHNLWTRTLASAWQPLDDSPVYCLDSPAAAMATPTTLTVACEGGDHALYKVTASVSPGVAPTFTRSSWVGLGGILIAGPAIAKVPGIGLDLMVLGQDSVIYEFYAGVFHYNGFVCTGHPALAADPAGAFTIFGCHAPSDGALYWAVNTGSGWTVAASLGGLLIDGPAVVVTSQSVTFYAEGVDQQVYERTLSADWTSDGGSAKTGVGATGLF